jgi:hypothetical protein
MFNLDHAHKLITTVGAVITVLLGIGAIYVAARTSLTSRIRVKRILKSDDEDFPGVCELHEKLFEKKFADDKTDLQRWLDEAEAARKSGVARLEDILIAVGNKS